MVRPGDTDLPAEVLFPAITRAREIFDAGRTLDSAQHLRLVVDLPAELDGFDGPGAAAASGASSRRARRLGAHSGYIARARRAWWSVGLRAPAPILATYMARRPPAFTRNLAPARATSTSPTGCTRAGSCPSAAIERLVAALRETVTVDGGRTYAGGLTKFEPREMERLLVPGPICCSPARLTVAVAFEPPPRWSREEIEGDIARAVESFRRERGSRSRATCTRAGSRSATWRPRS